MYACSIMLCFIGLAYDRKKASLALNILIQAPWPNELSKVKKPGKGIVIRHGFMNP